MATGQKGTRFSLQRDTDDTSDIWVLMRPQSIDPLRILA